MVTQGTVPSEISDEQRSGEPISEALLSKLYEALLSHTAGQVAAYLPHLVPEDPDMWGVAFCPVDGGPLISFGDASTLFSLGSLHAPLSYCLARLTQKSFEAVHTRVGCEPSGCAFNHLALQPSGTPHNPMVNAGCIVVSGLCCAADDSTGAVESVDARMRRAQNLFGKMGLSSSRTADTSSTSNCCKHNSAVNTVDHAAALAEKEIGDRNVCLAYLARESRVAFGPGTISRGELDSHLEFYYQLCALRGDCRSLAVVAATLANGGTNPVTQESTELTHGTTVPDCLNLLYTCGMYDYSGTFAMRVGLPAKSGVSGGMIVVIPGVGGFCLFSPKLDRWGNPLRGIEFCNRLAAATGGRYHIFRRGFALSVGKN